MAESGTRYGLFAGLSIVTTVGAALLVNLLSQEFHLPVALSFAMLLVVVGIQILLAVGERRGVVEGPGLAMNNQYLTNLGLSAIFGSILGYVIDAIPLLTEISVSLPGFYASAGWLIAMAAMCVFSGSIAHAGRPTWVWISTLTAGFLGILLANVSLGVGEFLFLAEWWVACVVLIFLVVKRKDVWRHFKEIRAKS